MLIAIQVMFTRLIRLSHQTQVRPLIRSLKIAEVLSINQCGNSMICHEFHYDHIVTLERNKACVWIEWGIQTCLLPKQAMNFLGTFKKRLGKQFQYDEQGTFQHTDWIRNEKKNWN